MPSIIPGCKTAAARAKDNHVSKHSSTRCFFTPCSTRSRRSFQLIFQTILVCCQGLKYTFFPLAYVLEHMMLKLEEFCSGNSVQLAGEAELFLGREGAEWFPADVAL